MIKTLFSKYSNRFISKWLVLSIDMAIVVLSFLVATFIRFEFSFQYFSPDLFKYHLLLVFVIKTICFLYYKSYTGIIRHTSMDDAYVQLKAVLSAAIFLSLISIFTENDKLTIPLSLIAIDAFISLFVLVFTRLLVKNTYDELIKRKRGYREVAIYGCGEMGRNLANSLAASPTTEYNVLFFIDDNPTGKGKSSEGKPVIHKDEFLSKIDNGELEIRKLDVVMAINNISVAKKALIANQFLERGLVLKSIPKIDDLLNAPINVRQIEDVKIEDLLERDPIETHNEVIGRVLKERTVLVTGAAGSIGSEIARQLITYDIKRLILVDINESGLYDFETDTKRIRSQYTIKDMQFEVADVTDQRAMTKLFEKFRPSFVFHCAAYKHVPLMEKNPYKAVSVNVFGTKTLADISVKMGVKRFVMISTDKAVNPTNVMGATKRIAEMYVQSLGESGTNTTEFVTTRFGNVLGSNGSVVPLFKRQIQSGGPITVTHPEITRYFMTIPEACQLVLEAGTMGKAKEIYVFDMGQPVKIYDLAVKMVQLAGLRLGNDISIEFTGLREGEKLYEELLAQEENTQLTYHPKILIAKVREIDNHALYQKIDQLLEAVKLNRRFEIVKVMKDIVPEFISNNSEYEQLDLKK